LDNFSYYLDKIETVWKPLQHFAYALVKKIIPAAIIDVGIYKGFSTLALARFCEGEVFGVDDFRIQGSEITCLKNIEDIGEMFNIRNITIIKGGSVEVAKEWKHRSADIIHLDASHDYESVKADYDAYREILVDDGIILMHDVYNEAFIGPRKVFKESDMQYKLSLGEGLGLGILTNSAAAFKEIRSLIGNIEHD